MLPPICFRSKRPLGEPALRKGCRAQLRTCGICAELPSIMQPMCFGRLRSWPRCNTGVALVSAYGFRSLSCLLPGSIRPLSFVNMVFCGAKAVVLSVICSVINCNRPGMRIDRAISPLSGRSSAPKTAKTRVQLRGHWGELLTQQEETDRFVAYCQKVYHAPPEPGPLLTDLALVGPGPLPESSTPLDPGAAPASGSRPPPVPSTSDVEASSPLSRSVLAACPA